MKHEDDKCMIKEFDISLGSEFEKVPARVLPPPQLLYKNDCTTNVFKGTWQTDKLEFLKPCSLLQKQNSWTILNLDNRVKYDSLENLRSMLQSQGKK